MACFMSFNLKSYQAVCARVEKLNSVMQAYRSIIDAYVSDFYTCEHWFKLPESLRDYFDAVDPPELAWMLAIEGDGKQQLSVRCVIPLSLLALHCCIQNMSLRRLAVNMDSKETRFSISSSLCVKQTCIPKEADPQATAPNLVETEAIQKPSYKNGQCMDMTHIFRRHVKPKKQHEIDKLGQVIGFLSQLMSCSNVVDVGAGLGHLSRLLTFQHGLRVTSIEAEDGHAPLAAEYDRQMRKDVHKAIEKGKVVLEAQSSVESSVNISKELHVIKKSTVNKTGNSNSSMNKECHIINNPDHSGTSCNGKASLCSRSTDCSSSSRPYINKKCNKHESSRNMHLLTGTKGKDQCYVSANADCFPVSGVLRDEDLLPNYVVYRVQPDIASFQFLEILKLRTQKDEVNEDERSADFILAGLHACGDLTPTLLRVFVNCKAAVGLASVACCYMKMSASTHLASEAPRLDNYPMSQFLRCLPCSQLSYEARELACHFADAYFARLKDNSPHLVVHSFRAALQYLITAVNPQFESGCVRLVAKKQAPGSFVRYVTENLKKIGTDMSTIPQDLIDYCENLTKDWKRVVGFYTLRLCLAPAVETLILLDRALFLLENGLHCAVVPIFDPTISPRNFALLATKR
ncbi:hypothetical protein BsWGS_05480 [Bradybaena similaris]